MYHNNASIGWLFEAFKKFFAASFMRSKLFDVNKPGPGRGF